MDNLEENVDIFGRTIYPPPLPPTRKIELIRTEVNFPSPCCCCKSTGKLTCARCKAIKYCSEECQRNGSVIDGGAGWKEHKDSCNKIRKYSEETKDAIEELSRKFGGTEDLLRSPLVKQGRFRYQSIAGELMGKPPLKAKNSEGKYVLARMRLIEAYVKCGEEALSCTAFRLAAENMLDLLCLCYSHPDGEHVRYSYCGWMVAAGMDQQALNYLCYFRYRILSPNPLPYLDLSRDEDIEGESYLELLKEKQSEFDWSPDMWFHDYMLIALIKYKRLQSLVVQRRKHLGSWKNFIMGTHPRAGKASIILKIRGNRRIMKMLEEYVVEEPGISRITFLDNQIKEILSAVKERNPLIIPGLIDRNSIPQEPSFQEEDKDDDLSDDYEYDEHDGDIHDACWAFGNYGHAWNMSSAYRRVLEFFLRTGKVMSGPWKNECFLVEGLLQAAFDVDPTRFYGRGDDLDIEGMVPRWAFNMEGNGEEEKEEGNVATANGEQMKGHGEEKEEGNVATANKEQMKGNGEEKEEGNIVTANEEQMKGNGEENEEGNIVTANEEQMKGNGEEKEEGNVATANEEQIKGNGKKEEGNVATANEEQIKGNGEEEEEGNLATANEEQMKGNGEGNVATANKCKEENKEDIKMMYSKMCWYCSKEDCKLYKCAGCRKARYCKDECQEKDWDVHGNYCLKQQQQREKIEEEAREAVEEMGRIWM